MIKFIFFLRLESTDCYIGFPCCKCDFTEALSNLHFPTCCTCTLLKLPSILKMIYEATSTEQKDVISKNQ